MKQYSLNKPYLNFPEGQIFTGPVVIRGQSNKGYVPIGTNVPPEGSEMCLFASFVEKSDIFTEVKQETK